MRKCEYTLIDIFVGFAIIGILATFGFEVFQVVTCRQGHEEFTGGFECWGGEYRQTCEPEKRFVCDDKENQ